ncbi:MAG TPA: VWA domain-containing protein [Thermoanaerobaculia bacterium]|nr:VWA domain-containing protein [Thermoanaerobaculia bacterium]
MSRSWRVTAGILGVGLCGSAALAQAPLPVKPEGFREEARVELVVVDAHVTDRYGDPIPNLTPADFRARVDDKPVLLESVDWIPADLPEIPFDTTLSAAEPGKPILLAPPGRLIVLFFQTGFEHSRLVGLVRMSLQARRFLDDLLPTDRVAVVSYDSHLKLRQDFTNDHERIREALYDAIRTGREAPIETAYFPSIAEHFDFAAAKDAATPERGLFILARALAPIPGGKTMLFFGWGLSTVGGISGPTPTEQHDYGNAMRALAAARTNIFTLDVTDADFHSLEVHLENLALATGGTYQKTHLFPSLAMDRVRRAISGRYVLTFKSPPGPRGYHSIEVKLLGHKGAEVNARQYYED